MDKPKRKVNVSEKSLANLKKGGVHRRTGRPRNAVRDAYLKVADDGVKWIADVAAGKCVVPVLSSRKNGRPTFRYPTFDERMTAIGLALKYSGLQTVEQNTVNVFDLKAYIGFDPRKDFGTDFDPSPTGEQALPADRERTFTMEIGEVGRDSGRTGPDGENAGLA